MRTTCDDRILVTGSANEHGRAHTSDKLTSYSGDGLVCGWQLIVAPESDC